MFEFSFPELVVVCVIALLVLGPDKLPGALRTLGLWIGRISRTFVTMKTEIEREIGMDEIRRQLHNEAVMDQIKRLERDVRGEDANGSNHADAGATDPVTTPATAPPTTTSPITTTSPATNAQPHA